MAKSWVERLAAAAYFTSPEGQLNHRIIHVVEFADGGWKIKLLTGSTGKERAHQAAHTRREALMYYLLEIGKLTMAGYKPEIVDKFPLEL